MSKTERAVKNDYAAFIKKAEVESKKKSFEMPVDVPIMGVFHSLEYQEGKGKGKKKMDNSFISLTPFDKPDTMLKYWSYGLLNHLIVEAGLKKGDKIYFKKTPKNAKGFWGCEFYYERVGK